MMVTPMFDGATPWTFDDGVPYVYLPMLLVPFEYTYLYINVHSNIENNALKYIIIFIDCLKQFLFQYFVNSSISFFILDIIVFR